LPEANQLDEPFETAIAFKRVKDYQRAHVILLRLHQMGEDSFEFYRNFAEVKIALANELYSSRGSDWQLIRRLQREAHDLLVSAIQLAENPEAEAWCHYNLARVKTWLRYPASQIDSEFNKAISLLPFEKTFSEVYQRYRKRGKG
jgi:hypothetical protein